MKTFDNHLLEVLSEMGRGNGGQDYLDRYNEAANRYAKAAIQEDRQRIYDAISPKFDSGIDKVGFIYMDGLKELLSNTQIILP